MSDLYVISTGRNASKFVLKCVQSVKKQTFKPKEHIIIEVNIIITKGRDVIK